MLKNIFGFADHQEKASYGLCYRLTLRRNKDRAALEKTIATTNGRIKIDYIHWYVAHYTPSIQQQGVIFKQILSKTPTELRYVERSVFMNEVNNQKLWNFDSRVQENMNVPIWKVFGFQQWGRKDSQNLNNKSFNRLPVTIAQYIIGTEKYPDAAKLLNFDDDDYNQGYSQIKEVFRALTTNDILQPNKSDDCFRSSNAGLVELGYKFYVFEIRCQQNFTTSQPNKIKFEFDGVVSNDVNGYALVLTNKFFSVSSHGRRRFDSI